MPDNLPTEEVCTREGFSCLQALASGFILGPDLCPGCTRLFMQALDEANGEPLIWHNGYRWRARRGGAS